MGKKKKGKKGKKGKSKKKKVVEEKKNMYEIPPFVDPKTCTPMVTLHIRLAAPYTEPLMFDLEVPITT